MELLLATMGTVSLQPTFCLTEESVGLYQAGLKLRT